MVCGIDSIGICNEGWYIGCGDGESVWKRALRG